MTGEKVLVVDDEPGIVLMLKEWLENTGYQVITAPDGQAAIREFFDHRPDLAIIDLMMPNLNGFELCKRIREMSNAPLIILTARNHELDKVQGLNAGADEYLVKPVGAKELIARIQATLRRAQMAPPEQQLESYRDAVLTINHSRHEVLVRGKKVDLTPTEFRLLDTLVQHAGQVLYHDQLLEKVWGMEYISSQNVKWYVKYLRDKIEEDPAKPKLIVNVRGVGYLYERPA